MTPQQVITLHSAGNHIAAHTINHYDLTTLSFNRLRLELSQPQAYLQNLLGVAIRDFASPYGSYNSRVLSQIKNYYRSHRTVDEGFNTKSSLDLYKLKVQNVESSTTTNEIISWVSQAKQDHSWLILVYHEIKPNPSQWDTDPATFDSHMNAIKNSGVAVVTLDQAIGEILPQL